MSQVQFDIEWTDEAQDAIVKLYGQKASKGKGSDAEVEPPAIGLPPLECCPSEGDILFLGPKGKQKPFIVAERQYHHDGGDDWTIVLIIDLPQD